MPQYRCPGCNSEFVFVEVVTRAKLIQIDHDYGQRTETRTEIEPAERLRWNSDSFMKCAKCGYANFARVFDERRKKVSGPPLEADVFNREQLERAMRYGYGGGDQEIRNQFARDALAQIATEGTMTGRFSQRMGINRQNEPRFVIDPAQTAVGSVRGDRIVLDRPGQGVEYRINQVIADAVDQADGTVEGDDNG